MHLPWNKTGMKAMNLNLMIGNSSEIHKFNIKSMGSGSGLQQFSTLQLIN